MRLGFGEILVILVLALLFFGPSKLPQLGASLGEAIKGFKRGLQDANEPDAEKPAQVAAAPAAAPAAVKPPSAQA